MLVSHLANKHITSFGLPSYDTSGYYGLSDFLFLKESDDLDEAILSITDKLASIGVNSDKDEEANMQQVNGLIEKVKNIALI